ncbi:MAG: methyltransferase domain-containing protein [Desulfovibrio sp.]|jgi:glycosyltransferase involved in cell wall biosynthesis|nr:methyltransferase domain-containing protein [Desulfovibrio sp.]
MTDIYIATPVLNAEKHLDETIWSVLSQAGDVFIHYHVQDGGSTDGTLEKLNVWQDKLKSHHKLLPANIEFSIATEKSNNCYHAISMSFERFSLKERAFMGWLNAGEILLPGALSLLAHIADEYPEIQWIIGECAEKKIGISSGSAFPGLLPREVFVAGLADDIHWPRLPHEGVFWRQELWSKTGGFGDAVFREDSLCGDWRLWRTFAQLVEPVFIQALLAAYYQRPKDKFPLQSLMRQEINRILPFQKRQIRSQALENIEKNTFTSLALFLAGKQLRLEKVKYSKNQIHSMKQVKRSTHYPYKDNYSKKNTPIFTQYTDFNEFTYARESHIKLLADTYLIAADGRPFDPEYCDLKAIQDGLCCAFIDQMITGGSRILEVGGGNSRILPVFCRDHECWNIDKFEGNGNGPTNLPEVEYKIVRDYMGNGNAGLPDAYFDLVFSISALEHVPYQEEVYADIMRDIDRVLKPGGFSIHFLDIVQKADGQLWMHPFTEYMFDHVKTFNYFIKLDEFPHMRDIYWMNEKSYTDIWEKTTRARYADFGRPSSIAVFWKKFER